MSGKASNYTVGRFWIEHRANTRVLTSERQIRIRNVDLRHCSDSSRTVSTQTISKRPTRPRAGKRPNTPKQDPSAECAVGDWSMRPFEKNGLSERGHTEKLSPPPRGRYLERMFPHRNRNIFCESKIEFGPSQPPPIQYAWQVGENWNVPFQDVGFWFARNHRCCQKLQSLLRVKIHLW